MRARAGWRQRPWTHSVRSAVPRRAQDVLEALRHKAPLDVCLFLDDVHEVPTDRRARNCSKPSHARCLIRRISCCPGTVPCLPLARREAAGEVVRIDTAALAFTDAETSALAGRFGRELAENHGWPALIRLSLTAGPGASWRYAADARDEPRTDDRGHGVVAGRQRRSVLELRRHLVGCGDTRGAQADGERRSSDAQSWLLPLFRVLPTAGRLATERCPNANQSAARHCDL